MVKCSKKSKDIYNGTNSIDIQVGIDLFTANIINDWRKNNKN